MVNIETVKCEVGKWLYVGAAATGSGEGITQTIDNGGWRDLMSAEPTL